MKMPALGPETSLRISRQGGLVAAPALTRPRQIEFADCDPAQRRGLCSVVERCLPVDPARTSVVATSVSSRSNCTIAARTAMPR